MSGRRGFFCDQPANHHYPVAGMRGHLFRRGDIQALQVFRVECQWMATEREAEERNFMLNQPFGGILGGNREKTNGWQQRGGMLFG